MSWLISGRVPHLCSAQLRVWRGGNDTSRAKKVWRRDDGRRLGDSPIGVLFTMNDHLEIKVNVKGVSTYEPVQWDEAEKACHNCHYSSGFYGL